MTLALTCGGVLVVLPPTPQKLFTGKQQVKSLTGRQSAVFGFTRNDFEASKTETHFNWVGATRVNLCVEISVNEKIDLRAKGALVLSLKRKLAV